MQNRERPIALVKNISIKGRTVVSYDLHLTDKRMVLIHVIDPKRNPTVSPFGLVGSLADEVVGKGMQKIQESRKKRKEEELEGLTLDEMIRRDKKSFDIPYDDIKKVKLSYSRWSGHMLAVDSRQRYETFSLSKEQSEQLSNLLPNIVGIKEKLA
jgi:hypothetical protein